MDEIISIFAPAWLVVGGTLALFVVAFALGYAACFALGIRRRLDEYEAHAAYAPDVAREFRRLEAKLDNHLEQEHCGPMSVKQPLSIRA